MSKVVNTPIGRPDKDARNCNEIAKATLDGELLNPSGAVRVFG